MATEKQIQANRNNAQKSTGPRTEQGKSRASQNALKHGLLARDAVIQGEDPADFEAQLAALAADLQPEGAIEYELVRQIADAQWRMQRLARLETAYLNARFDFERRAKAGFQPTPRNYSDQENALMLGNSLMGDTVSRLSQLARYDAHLGRRFERALQQIAKLREARERRAQAAPQNPRRKPAGMSDPAPRDAAQTPPPEICETNPISPNKNGINKIASTSPVSPDLAQPETNHNTPQTNGGWSCDHQLPSVNGAASRQDPLSR